MAALGRDVFLLEISISRRSDSDSLESFRNSLATYLLVWVHAGEAALMA